MGTGDGNGEWERGMGTENGNGEWEMGNQGNRGGVKRGIRWVTTGNILKKPKLHLCRLIMHPRHANSLRTRAKTVRY